MSEQRPRDFTVTYNGKPLIFERVTKEHGSKKKPGTIIGYAFMCPRCAKNKGHFASNWIDTESGTRHGLEFDNEGRATLRGSILCRTKWAGGPECGWHVTITNGIATDAG